MNAPDLVAESERLFLADLLRSPDGIAGLISAPEPYDRKPFKDGGKWRGSVPVALYRAGIIRPLMRSETATAATAKRPARHAGIVRLWKLINRRAAESRFAELSARPRRNPTLFDGLP